MSTHSTGTSLRIRAGRAQIDRYPKLTEVGSKRAQTVIGRMTGLFDETPYGGYYTKDEMREVVKYAADRYITVIPEIDMPGHMLGAWQLIQSLVVLVVLTKWLSNGAYSQTFSVLVTLRPTSL